VIQLTPRELHTEVQMPSLYMCAALRQYSSRAPWRLIYSPEVYYIWMSTLGWY
jgi:hypothetical protein